MSEKKAEEYKPPFVYLKDEKDDDAVTHLYRCRACDRSFRTCLEEGRHENTVVEDGHRMLKCPGCGAK